jgi:hypothetical protein
MNTGMDAIDALVTQNDTLKNRAYAMTSQLIVADAKAANAFNMANEAKVA